MRDLKIFDDFNLKVQIQVAWVDMDALGHVNSSKYFAYFETARIKYFENLGLLKYFSLHKIAGVLSKTDCNYFIQLSYPDILTVGARVTNLFKEHIIMEYFIKSELHGLSTIGESEIVFYDYKTNNKISVPAKVIDEIITFENDKVKMNR